MSALDPIAALRTILLADDELAAVIDERIYGGEVPDAAAKAMPQACVILSPAGGADTIGRGYSEIGDSRIDTLCHGRTLMESWAVYLIVYRLLKQLERTDVTVGDVEMLVHWARPLSKGVLARDPETQWPTTLASWRVLAAEAAG